MNIKSDSRPITEVAADVLVLGLHDDSALHPLAQVVSDAHNGQLKTWLDQGEISTALAKSLYVPGYPGIAAKALLIVGCGSSMKVDARATFRAAAAGVKAVAHKSRGTVAIAMPPWKANLQESAVAGSICGGVGQDLFRAEKSLFPPATISWLGVEERALQRGQVLGTSLNLTRHLVNLPPNHLYPETFVQKASQSLSQFGISIEVWDENRLKSEKCDALLAVAAGSARPPRLMIMRYAGNGSTQDPIALVGKGVTFDSGGLSIKPTDGMTTMKCDIAGAATVVGVLPAVAQIKVARPVIGVVGLVENMLDGGCYKLGDVISSRSGTTIEVLNTDAEGRIVLADALNVAVEQKPSHIIDIATLTGACLVALGSDVVGAMSNDKEWEEKVISAAKSAGEYIWPLPMFSFFDDQIQSKIADIKNVGDGRWGGAITAAKFLQRFVAHKPWVHLDIAGPAFYDSAKNWQDAGGTGVMVRSLVQLLEGLE